MVGEKPTEVRVSIYNPWAAPVVASEVVATAKLATGVEVLIPAVPLEELTMNLWVPEPFCIVNAVVEEIFMSRPPAPVKPERKEPEELKLLRRLPV